MPRSQLTPSSVTEAGAALVDEIGFAQLGMGLIAEIIIRTYFESQDKVAYLITETQGFAKKPLELVNKAG